MVNGAFSLPPRRRFPPTTFNHFFAHILLHHTFIYAAPTNEYFLVGGRALFPKAFAVCVARSCIFAPTFPPRKAPVLSTLSTLRTVLLVFLSTCHDYLVFLKEPFPLPSCSPVSSLYMCLPCTTTLTAWIFVYH